MDSPPSDILFNNKKMRKNAYSNTDVRRTGKTQMYKTTQKEKQCFQDLGIIKTSRN